MELTIRDIPDELGRALEARAAAEGKSVDQVVLDALRVAGLRFAENKRDLSDIAGTWVEDPEVDAALRDQDRVDPEMWK